MEASLFVTCLTDQFYPHVGMAIVDVLSRLGVHLDFPEQQTCCGQPALNNGFLDEARALARRMIDVFADSPCVISPSGSCCAVVREHYPRLFADDPDWHRRAVEMAAKTYEFVEFLVKVLHVDLRSLGVKFPAKVTYHYNCHLRGLGITDEAIQLLRQIEGVEYAPMEKHDHCCGFGGTFALKYAAISAAIVDDKVRCIEATGADVLVCNDAGCSMNVSGALRRQGIDIRTMHLAEIINQGMPSGK